MQHKPLPLPIAAAALLTIYLAPCVRAAITATGDTAPANPATWTGSTRGYIGKTADGTLTVDGDSDLLSGNGYISWGQTTTAQVNIVGEGSTWDASNLYVAMRGVGSLNITSGGAVSSREGYIGYDDSTSKGEVLVDGEGSSWINERLYLGYNAGSEGTVTVSNGGYIYSTFGGRLGFAYGSTGKVIVTGAGSKWYTFEPSLRVGYYGKGYWRSPTAVWSKATTPTSDATPVRQAGQPSMEPIPIG